jgi:pseudouridine-5'-phosphate glycosidase
MNFKTGVEVDSAIQNGRPIVALESTVIAHGLPFPENLDTARRMEHAVRDSGAVPATIALLEGIPTVGLSDNQLKHFAKSDNIRKASIRDLAVVSSMRLDGATTVASTMYIAHRAGIGVFATGGIGGVHRGGKSDVSADLPVLAATPMVTVCSGAKIVLDLEATREWLETYGVCVLGWKTNEYPAFYSRKSGLDVDVRVENVGEIVSIIRARNELEMEQAILLTVPPPIEIEAAKLDKVLNEALRVADEEHISGKEITPFLLSHMAKISTGKTIETNIALLLNNARIAGNLAVELA